MKTLVVAAHNNENLDWLKQCSWSRLVYNQYRPPGRESHAILKFIQDHTILEEEEIVFCQGNPFDHSPEFLTDLENPEIKHYGYVTTCDHNAGPQWVANMDAWCEVLGLERQPIYYFVAGAQYRLTGAQILARRWELYKTMLNLTELNEKAPWVFERLWPIVWGITL